ncbi:MAG: RNase adapter RapZ [Candidatus Cloacimonetes bacterium]|nr:RNase adapter RapZ [Candidatus Cloacimonadota bacterium]
MKEQAFYLLTGLAGAGKSTALKALEDSDFYCVDNLPAALFDKFFELLAQSIETRKNVALGVDIRSGNHFSSIVNSLKILDVHQIPYKVIFLDCKDEELIKRFKETRRRHPIYKSNLSESIKRDRKLLSPLLDNADIVINTSNLKTRELSNKILDIIKSDDKSTKIDISISSFGFKHGIPQDADMVLDVRFMDNPFYQEGLRSKRGFDQEVQDFIFNNPDSSGFINETKDYLLKLIPRYVKEGRKQFSIAIGCTGGHHRSVASVELIAQQISDLQEVFINKYHRDIKK